MPEPFRILNIISNLRKGGTEQFVMNYYRNVDRTKIQYDFLVLSNEKGIYEEEINNLGGRVYKIPSFKTDPVKNISQRTKFFKNHQYDVVEIHAPNPMRFSYAKTAKKYGTKYVIYHAHNTSNKPKTFLNRMAENQISKYCDYKFSCSGQAGKYVFGMDDFTVIPNAIDVNTFAFNNELRKKIRHEFNVTDSLIVGHIGRLTEQKNHKFLINVFKELVRLDEKARLLLIGDGELKSELKTIVKENGLQNNVIFLGVRQDTPALLSAMDVFVLPSLWEGLGIVGIEAQSSGLPCLFADTITEEICFTDNVDYLGLNEDPELWAAKILELSRRGRNDTIPLIKSAGYDIHEQAEKMSDFYVGLFEEGMKNNRKI